ncbi:MAG TPA: hypothetical protein DCX06_04700 [Opitutae bacterium]|nr:hypothetical protein [Opitutae bacterium]
MKKIISLFLALAALNCFGAKEKQPSMPDLLKAMSVHYFERTLPEEIKETDMVYLTLLKSDGTQRDLVGATGFTGNEKVKVFVFLRADDPYATLMSNDGLSSYTANSLPKWNAFATGSKEVKEASDHMIRFTPGNTIQSGDKPQGECYDLIITSKPN